MITTPPPRTRLLSLCAVAALGGCAASNQTKSERLESESRAILAAARASRINMFGDLGDAAGPPYSARTAVSLRQHTSDEIGGDADPDLDPTGRRLVFSSTRHHTAPDLYMKSVDGVAVTQLTSDPSADVQPAFSPDGARLAFASNRAGNWDIWLMSVDGTPPVQVTQGDSDEIHPSWSPDGRQIVYCSLPRGAGAQWELWVADASSGGTRRFIGYGLFPEWSPTGEAIVYQRARERGTQWFSIWTLTMVDGEPRYPTEVAASATQAMIVPTWSSDGRRIAFAATAQDTIGGHIGPVSEAGPFDIWVMQADGSGKCRLTDGHTLNTAPVFSPDGRIYFTSNRTGHENIWSVVPGDGLDGWTFGSTTAGLGAVPRPAGSPTAMPASVKNGL